jgi:hypothetical protein
LENDSEPSKTRNQHPNGKPTDSLGSEKHSDPKPCADQSSRHYETKKHPLDFGIFILLFFTLIATSIAACYTRKQWLTADDAEKQQLRAFVISNKIQIINYGARENRALEWEVSAIIENTGNTPARKLHISSATVEGVARKFQVQNSFTWSDPNNANVGSAKIIGPKSEINGPAYTTHADDLDRIAHLTDSIEMAGVVSYQDIFEKSHRTEFCFSMSLPQVDFEHYPVGQAIRSDPQFCPKHNCADDDCK